MSSLASQDEVPLPPSAPPRAHEPEPETAREQRADDRFGFCPPPPTTLAEVGLPFSFVCDLLLKILYFRGDATGHDLARAICLPWGVTSEVIAFITKENFCGTTGVLSEGRSHDDFAEGLQYQLTSAGRERAREVLQLSQYAGPAPVPMDDYLSSAEWLATTPHGVSTESLREALGALVLRDRVVDTVGAALIARQALFLFGPPGNGKSTIAHACAEVLGSPIFIPNALYVHGEVVRVFDPVHHRPVLGPPIVQDQRWTLVYRPVVRTGGELRSQQLEPAFDRVLGFYEAPLQVKANGGIFHVDDFGRQVISPRQILNRLIVPLETGVDHLNIPRAGTSVSVPYATILLLSTNLNPSELVDEAFLRRVRYKALVGDPSEEEYRRIFKRVCRDLDVDFSDEAIDYLMTSQYQLHHRPLRGCHPRDLVRQVLSIAEYLGRDAELSHDLLDRAARSYFADFAAVEGLVAAEPHEAERLAHEQSL